MIEWFVNFYTDKICNNIIFKTSYHPSLSTMYVFPSATSEVTYPVIHHFLEATRLFSIHTPHCLLHRVTTGCSWNNCPGSRLELARAASFTGLFLLTVNTCIGISDWLATSLLRLLHRRKTQTELNHNNPYYYICVPLANRGILSVLRARSRRLECYTIKKKCRLPTADRSWRWSANPFRFQNSLDVVQQLWFLARH